jgi:hypothetical protein
MIDVNALMFNPFEEMEVGRKRAYAGYEAGQAAAQREALNELYAQALDPRTGQVNVNALYGGLAQRRMGAMIPGMQKEAADVAFKEAQARKQNQDAEIAFLKQSRDDLATIFEGDQAAYQAWASRMIERAPWTAQYIAPVLNAETKKQMLKTADAAMPKGEVRDVGGILATIDPYTGQEIGRVDLSAADIRAKTAGRAVSNINMPRAQTAYETTVGGESGKADIAAFDTASKAASSLQRDYEALNLLRRGEPSTGITADLELQFNRLKGEVGGDKQAAKRVEQTQLLNALLGQNVFDQIQALGVGARGLDTPAEREYLREVISGTVSLNRETLIRMAEIRANVQERMIDRFNARVESGELDRFFEASGRRKQKIEKPEKPVAAPAAPKVGAVENGDRFKGGDPSNPASWEKVK